MAYARPSLTELIARAKGDISSRTLGSAFLKRSFERVIAYVLAGLAHGMHGHLDWVRRQILPTTCEIDGLLAWGVMLDVPRNGAEVATGDVTFVGTVNTTPLPIGTQMQDASGATYTVTVGGVVTALSVTVTVEADEAGSAGNLEAGATLTLLSPIAGIESSGTVAADFSGGTDLEDVEAYRERILDALRVPPSGGGPGDYVKWAKEVAGVTRAWEYGNRMGYGTVSLAFVRDGDGSGAAIIPSAGEVTAVQDYIDALKPIDMRALYVQAPVAATVNITVSIRPNTAAVRAAITASLEELFASEWNAGSELEATMSQSLIDEAISTADGEEAHSITAISSLNPGSWGILVLGSITFNTLS